MLDRVRLIQPSTRPSTSSQTRLALYDAMCLAIANAHEVDEVKHIRDKAVALEAYSRQAHNLDNEMYAAEIRLRAERKVGELLKDMDKPKGGRPAKTHSFGEQVSARPLKSFGITGKQSHLWQKLAAVPNAFFEAAVTDPRPRKATTVGIISGWKEQERHEQRRQTAERGARLARSTPQYALHQKSCREAIEIVEANSVDWLVTDPPYAEKYLWVYDDLAELAGHALKPGGALFCMTGNLYRRRVEAALDEHLNEHWIIPFVMLGIILSTVERQRARRAWPRLTVPQSH